MGKLESFAYAFLSIPPMYVFLNEVLLLSGRLGISLMIVTLIATLGVLYASIEESTRYIATRIKDEIKAAHAAGFLNILSFVLAFIWSVQRTSSLSVYTRLLTVFFISLSVPLAVTYFRAARLSRRR